MKYVFLYNPLAGEGRAKSYEKRLGLSEQTQTVCRDITEIENLNEAARALDPEDKIVICGGDGTLNRFVNTCDIARLENEILYLPAGSGNDFMHDLNRTEKDGAFAVKELLSDLPELKLQDRTLKFINGIGYGIDGYCCAEGARLRSRRKRVNYTLIALKGMLLHFRPTTARVTVDGKQYTFEKVWMTPAMKGRFFGGGMMVAPGQNRFDNDNELTLVVAHNLSMLGIISIFPAVFKGAHVKYTKYVTFLKGKSIQVKFDRPTALQIDGEVIEGVNEYAAEAGSGRVCTDEKREERI